MSARPLGAGSTELGSNVIELGLGGIEFWAVLNPDRTLSNSGRAVSNRILAQKDDGF